ncbi:hypothetical protein QLQ12_00725 [Actinoplanes sp. NEAU-A12]|uniref:Uncharacterized protein n=1 Tax=Actinoplanes sandaracinus TaxID=3045177 RepID=A0ABT6WBL0_9ACTN|nr:hypothetical protein [Actinoplanes sandaracinus]MDI6097131.1 hypothetical protein [Actinoplanes sandaracinus]
MITGSVRITAAALPSRSVPGLLAVSAAALISIAAIVGRSLSGGVGTGLLLVGLLVPLLVVAAVVAAQRWVPAGAGSNAVWEFTVRAASGSTVHVVLRTDAPRDSLRSGDLVRLTPSRSGSLARAATGRGGSVRAVEVLAALDGPVIRRVTATAALPPAQILGLALAVALLAETIAMVLLL